MSNPGRGATAIKHPEEYALRHNVRRDIIRAIALDLTRFQESFVELGFITQQNASGIMSKMGITAERKAGELFQSFEWKLDSSQNRQITFEDFVSIFAVEEATRELAEKILGNYGNQSGVQNFWPCCKVQAEPLMLDTLQALFSKKCML